MLASTEGMETVETPGVPAGHDGPKQREAEKVQVGWNDDEAYI